MQKYDITSNYTNLEAININLNQY